MGKGVQQKFLQRWYILINGQQVAKRCSISLIIREMQIKITTKYHFIPISLATINKTNDKC